MNDCTNAEIRDQLPDLLHERLDASARAAALAHISGCTDCRDELQLLRDVRVMLAAAEPAVDVPHIVQHVVQALPQPRGRVVSLASRRRPVWSDWRIAAAVTLLVAGGGSFALLRSNSAASARAGIDSSVVASAPAVTPVSVPVTTPGANEPATTGAATGRAVASTTSAASRSTTESIEDHAAADLGSGNRLGDLTEAQLQSLLKEIGHLRAVPVAEPEPVEIRVGAKVGTTESL